MRRKKLLYGLGAVALVLAILWVWFLQVIKIEPPKAENTAVDQLQRTEVSPGFCTIGNNWIQKNDAGLYEMYLEGAPYERGVIYGKLAKELVVKQEDYFVHQIQEIVPSTFYQGFLKYLIGWFNRDLDKNIAPEYLQEIYGVSQSASDDYSFIGTKYQRILNYHAAHDIGHALQDKRMVVGCTSFGAWGGNTTDSTMILGRNFDFYVGDDFARDKIVMFVNPDKGQQFMMVTWGGFTGTVSGMNMAGLTVTINAAKSDYPTGAATPISVVAREILQYATTIEEAFAIAKKRKTFVSESLLIGSANDKSVAIIEKTPTRTELYRESDEDIICSNHFQGKGFEQDEANLTQQKETSTSKRYERMTELLAQNYPLDYTKTANILRNYKGKGNTDIGIGNEDAINQLIAHHSIIFEPEKRLVWVSSNPVPFNTYVAYDLNKIFASYKGMKQSQVINEPQLSILADTFLAKGGYLYYEAFKEQRSIIKNIISKENGAMSQTELEDFVRSNPQYFEVYLLLGDYYNYIDDKATARKYYQQALTMDIPLAADRKEIEEKLKNLQSN